MESIDWHLCERRLKDRGVVGYTDGDIIAEYDNLCQERIQKAQAEADAKAAAEAIQAAKVATPVVDDEPQTVASTSKGRGWFNIA